MEKLLNNSLSKWQKWGRNNKKKARPLCLVCKKSVKQHFRKLCSVSCSNLWKYKDKKNHPNWAGGKIKLKCLNCKKDIERPRYHVKIRKHIVCSRRCQGIYYRRFVPRIDTGIEKMVEEAIKERQLYYEKQYNLWNICIADFYLTDYKMAIFVDGDYWHNLPNVVSKDKRQMKELNGRDIRIVRIWGSDVIRLHKAGRLSRLIDHLAEGKSIEDYFTNLKGHQEDN